VSLLLTDRAFHFGYFSVLLVLMDSFLLGSIFWVAKCRFEMFGAEDVWGWWRLHVCGGLKLKLIDKPPGLKTLT